MRYVPFILAFLGLLLTQTGPSYAEPILSDSRIKTLVYNENEVYNVTTHYGYQANIEFGRNEVVEAVSVGDRIAWQIVPAGRRLFIRAMEENAHTNMTIVTSKRAYQFDLRSSSSNAVFGSDELTYVLRFYYPEDGGTPPIQHASATNSNPLGDFANTPQFLPDRRGFSPTPQKFSAPTQPVFSTPVPHPNITTRPYQLTREQQNFSQPFPAPHHQPSPIAQAPFPSAPAPVTPYTYKSPQPSPVTVPAATPVQQTSLSPLQPIATPYAHESTATSFVPQPQPSFTPPEQLAGLPSPDLALYPSASPQAQTSSFADQPLATPSLAPAFVNNTNPTQASADLNYRYTYSGADDSAPVKIYDDGRSTYFKFRKAPVNAKFSVILANGEEQTIPHHFNELGLAVIDVVAPKVRMSDASGQVIIYNEVLG